MLEISRKTASYPDLPRTQFPVNEDHFNTMQDVSHSVLPLVVQYHTLFADGDLNACSELLKNNPNLSECFFNAEKFNQIRDAVLALERYYLEEVENFITLVAQNTIGIHDEPTEDQKLTSTYSAQKIEAFLKDLSDQFSEEIQELSTTVSEHKKLSDTRFSKIDRIISIDLLASKWSAAAPYKQVVDVEGMLETDRPQDFLHIPEGATFDEEKALKKAYGNISYFDTSNGYVTFTCNGKKPVTDFQVELKGG